MDENDARTQLPQSSVNGAPERSALFQRARATLRFALALFYGGAGLLHLHAPAAFLPIMPNWVPAPLSVIVATGLCEVAGAIGLLVPRLRRTAGMMLALYAVCVFPANLRHAFAHIDVPGLPSSWWYHAPRLAFQPVLVWCALFSADVLTWPLAPRPSSPARFPGSAP